MATLRTVSLATSFVLTDRCCLPLLALRRCLPGGQIQQPQAASITCFVGVVTHHESQPPTVWTYIRVGGPPGYPIVEMGHPRPTPGTVELQLPQVTRFVELVVFVTRGFQTDVLVVRE